MGILTGAISWIAGNFQLLAYAAGGVTILVLAVTVFNYISDAAKNQVLIEQYKQNQIALQADIKTKDDQLKFKDDQIALGNAATVNLNEQLEKLETRYDTINVQNLGKGVNDQAPDSIKELIRQIQKARG